MTMATPHGIFSFDPVSLLGVELCNHGEVEPGMRRNMERALRPGATFVDLGANEGYFTVIGARLVGPTGRVLAIEPQQRLLPILHDNIARNGLCNVTVRDVAIGMSESTQRLYLSADTNTGGSGLSRSGRLPLATQPVQVQRLQEVLSAQGIDRVDFMKIDIEGSEYEAVLASPEVFRQQRVDVLGMELHPTVLASCGKDAADIIKFLADCGYRMSEIEGHTVWTVEP
ncbi:MAG TPA: FkbM family methyltransferase [Hyphomicrobiaceae bacterium]|nr:FkbM family methyltransferase [Hyphomicrobiaceae bacterium]